MTGWIRFTAFAVVLGCLSANGARHATGQSVSWHKRVVDAQQASVRSGKDILIYFSGNGQMCEYIETVLQQGNVASAMMSRYEMVRLDFTKEREAATKLNVFKAGTVLVYGKSGNGLQSLSDMLAFDGFIRQLVPPTTNQAAKPKGNGHGAERQMPLAPTVTPHPKGRLVAGPVSVSAMSTAPQCICLLEPGKNYVIVFEGVFSISRLIRDRGTDVCFRYDMPAQPGRIMPSSMVKIHNPTGIPYYMIRDMTGSPPNYNTSHVYELPATGEGKILSAKVKDTEYRDNSGSFRILVYEAAR